MSGYAVRLRMVATYANDALARTTRPDRLARRGRPAPWRRWQSELMEVCSPRTSANG